jgi:PAS domain S-box-containing protein
MKIPSEWNRLLDRSTLPVLILDREFRFRYVNDAYLQTVQRTRAELIGEYVFDAFPETPERVEGVLDYWNRTLNGETTVLDALPFHVELDGKMEERFWEATQDPLYGDDGEIIGLIQRTQDITEQHKLEQRNEAIGFELSHRVKNVMAVVSSVARITGRNARDVPSFVKSFTARLNAMSRTNDLLAQRDWVGLSVRTLFEDELSPFKGGDNPAYTLSGDPVRLAIDATKDLSMVCHELATNAAKYGCLGKPGGHLRIGWMREGDTLVIDWQEQCAHTLPEFGEDGFGTRLFDMLPYAKVERRFTPTGLHLTIRMDGEKVFA